MIKKVVVKGFQRHLNKMVLEFSPTVTTIVGDSDVGKSSLLRLLRWICLNRPQGLGIVHKDANMASGTLYFGKHWVNRRRAEDTNLYELDGEVYRAFGNDVPEDIQNLLRVDDATFQMQADSHFWFGDSGGNVSKSLNEVVNLESIDHALAFTKDKTQKARMEEFLCKEQVEEFREQRKKLLWVRSFDADLADLESKQEAINSKRVLLASMAGKLAQASAHKRALKIAADATLAGERVVALGDVALEKNTRRWLLENLIQKAKKARKFSQVEVPDLDYVLARREEGDKVAERRRGLEMLLMKVRAAKAELGTWTTQLATAEETLSKESKKARRCPTCGQKLKPTKSHSHSQSPTYTYARRLR